MGELAQLSGRPYLVDAVALTDVEAIAIPPERLRALLIAEAELGERIMRALILRRVGLIEAGAGPIIVGAEGNADVLRLTNFLRRNGHPYQQLDPANDGCAADARRAVRNRARRTADRPLPGRAAAAQSERGTARALRRAGWAIEPDRLYDLVVIGAGPAGPRDLGLCRRPKGCRC